MNHPRIGRAVVATLAGAAVALSAAPVANAAPHTGCYRPTADRVLRIIPKADSCLKGERRISWNNTRTGGSAERGPRGLQGTSGAKGDKGDTGAAGAAGAAGAKGDQGLQGVQGQAGAPGPTGATGETGAQGAAGATGAQGAQGNTVTGPQGPSGPQGPEGPQGPQGNTVTGPQGPAGENGDPGTPGEAGPPGSPGAPGAQGEDGAPGSGTIFSSNSGLPAVATTLAGGLVGTVTTMPPNGSGLETGVSVVGGNTILRSTNPSGFDHGQVIARDGTITSVTAQSSLAAALSLVGTTVTQEVSVWKAPTSGSNYTQVPGATVTLAPSLTGLLATGTTADGTVTGLSIPVNAGDRLLVVYSVTATGLTLINTVSARVTSSIAVS